MGTCRLPGHPDCTISCPDGCIALYIEPNGPCFTACVGNTLYTITTIPQQSRLSVSIDAMVAEELAKIIGGALPLDAMMILSRSRKVLSLTLESVPYDSFVTALVNQVVREGI